MSKFLMRIGWILFIHHPHGASKMDDRILLFIRTPCPYDHGLCSSMFVVCVRVYFILLYLIMPFVSYSSATTVFTIAIAILNSSKDILSFHLNTVLFERIKCHVKLNVQNMSFVQLSSFIKF